MGRTVIRDVVIFSLLGVMVFTLLFTFATNLNSQYGVSLPAEYQVFADNVSDSSATLYDTTTDMEAELEESSGVEETTSGDEFSLSKSIIRGAKLVLNIPAMANTFIRHAASLIGIPPFVQDTAMAILLVIVVFTIISMIARKDT